VTESEGAVVAEAAPAARRERPLLSPPVKAALVRIWPKVRFLLGLGLVALVVWVLSAHTDELTGLESISDQLRWGWLLPAVIAEGASYYCLALAERRLLMAGGVKASTGILTGITLASQAIINSVPAGGAAATVYGFRWFRRLGAGEPLAAWALIGTLVVGVLSLALITAAGLALATSYGGSLDLVPVTLGVLVVTVGLGLLFLYRRPQRAVLAWLMRTSQRVTGRPRGSVDGGVRRIVDQLTAFSLSWRKVMALLALGAGNWLFDCACFAFSFLAVGTGIPWNGLLLAYGAGQLAANLPITPGGLGVVEGSLTIALVAFGGDRAGTVEAVLIYRLISFWGQLVVGWAVAGWLALGVRSGRWQRSVVLHHPILEEATVPQSASDEVRRVMQ
jgi:putative heme transporter